MLPVGGSCTFHLHLSSGFHDQFTKGQVKQALLSYHACVTEIEPGSVSSREPEGRAKRAGALLRRADEGTPRADRTA